MKKSIPIGVVNYTRLIEDNYYSVDKTLMIKEFLQRASSVTLITRPRRFGKTSNMSMMSEFFDISKSSKNTFKNTMIAKTEYYNEMNQYPTIFLSFAAAKGTITDLVKVMKEQIAQAYQKYSFVLKTIDDFEQPFYDAIRNSINHPEDGSLKGMDNAIKFLTKKLEQYYDKRVMIFIDEYDTPFIEAHVEGYYEDVRRDLSLMLQSALKDNDSLEYAMLTGIQRVSKENIFSHLNNILVCTVKDKEYAQYFGFTIEETKTLLEYYDLQLNEDVKAMYDGYNMGGVEIYNPWSIINYTSKKELIPFWVNTSSNTMMKDAMKKCDMSFQTDYEDLIQQGYIETQVNLSTSFYEVRSDANLWGLFVNAGYLTVEKTIDLENEIYCIRIPNREVLREFKSLTANYLQVSTKELVDLYDGIRNKDKVKFLRAYKILLLKNPSYHDLKDENSYHMFLLGICLYLYSEYEIISNREEGKGRCDIMLKVKRQNLPSYIIEFKYSKTETELSRLASSAIEQVQERHYDIHLQGEIIYVGIAHYGKEVVMCWHMPNERCS